MTSSEAEAGGGGGSGVGDKPGACLLVRQWVADRIDIVHHSTSPQVVKTANFGRTSRQFSLSEWCQVRRGNTHPGLVRTCSVLYYFIRTNSTMNNVTVSQASRHDRQPGANRPGSGSLRPRPRLTKAGPGRANLPLTCRRSTKQCFG